MNHLPFDPLKGRTVGPAKVRRYVITVPDRFDSTPPASDGPFTADRIQHLLWVEAFRLGATADEAGAVTVEYQP